MADNTVGGRGRGRGRRGGRPGPIGTRDITNSIPSASSPITETPSPSMGTSSPSTPHIGTSSVPSSTAQPTPSSTAQPTPSSTAQSTPLPSSSSSLNLPLMQPAPGTYDPSDRRTWIAPGAKFQLLPAMQRPAAEIPKIVKAKFDDAWPTWGEVPHEVKEMWFGEFAKKFKWMPEYELVIRGTFHHIGQKTMKDTMNKIRTGVVKGDWIAPDVRAKLDAIWAGPVFAKKSEIAKQNRAVDIGASVYTGGSVSTAVHRSRMAKELNREPTAFEIMKKTKLNKAGEWANDKAKSIAEEYQRRRAEVRADNLDDLEDDAANLSTASDNAIFLDVVGGRNKKGHVYGLGLLGEEFVTSSSQGTQSVTGPTVDYTHIIANLTEELEQTKSQMQQKLDMQSSELIQTKSQMQQKLDMQSSELSQTKELLAQLVQHLKFQPANQPTGGDPADQPTGGDPADQPTGGDPTDQPSQDDMMP